MRILTFPVLDGSQRKRSQDKESYDIPLLWSYLALNVQVPCLHVQDPNEVSRMPSRSNHAALVLAIARDSLTSCAVN